jgi:hypothetical protein
MGLTTVKSWFNSKGDKIFSYTSKRPNRLLCPITYLAQGVARALFSMKNWPGCEDDNLFSSNAEVKNEKSYNPLPHVPSFHTLVQLELPYGYKFEI